MKRVHNRDDEIPGDWKLYAIEDPLFAGKDEANDADSEHRGFG